MLFVLNDAGRVVPTNTANSSSLCQTARGRGEYPATSTDLREPRRASASPAMLLYGKNPNNAFLQCINVLMFDAVALRLLPILLQGCPMPYAAIEIKNRDCLCGSLCRLHIIQPITLLQHLLRCISHHCEQ